MVYSVSATYMAYSVSAAYMVYKRESTIVVSSGRTYSTKERSGIVSVDKQNGKQG